MLRLDYVSCVLTILSTILVGRKMWHGWVVAALNSIVLCLIGIRTAQFGFVPANLFCIGLYANNLSRWRPKLPKRLSPAVIAHTPAPEPPAALGIESLRPKVLATAVAVPLVARRLQEPWAGRSRVGVPIP